jgi:16S rRNA (cytosine1402-N4)-methyltransferase
MDQVIDLLNPCSGDIFFDGTLGFGGHSYEICRKIMPEGIHIGTDRDLKALNEAKLKLMEFSDRSHLYNLPYSRFTEVLKDCGLQAVDKVLLDIGVSSMQLDDASRGFSFQTNAPLDMRMDTKQDHTAADLIAQLPEKELADLIYNYGEERFSRRIAKRIVENRRKKSIKTTEELASIVRASVPGRSKIDKATRTFQALRIAVNDELGELNRFLSEIFDCLSVNGRIAIICFHSLEDRIVKNAFRDAAKFDNFKLLTKKPVTAEDDEIKNNPRSRSAKLRVIERTEDIDI